MGDPVEQTEGVEALQPMVSGAAARLASFVPIAIASLLATRILIEHYGTQAFNGYSLAISLILLVPLNDLGVGSAIASAFAAGGPRDPAAQRVLLTAMRTVGASGLLLCAVSLLMLPIGLWGDLLGPSVGAHGFFALSMVIYGATFIPALSQGVLLGVHKNHLTVLVQTLFTATNLAMILGLIALDAPAGWVVAVPASSLFLNSILTAGVTRRETGLRWLRLLRQAPFRRRHPGVSIRSIAVPRLILTVSMALAVTTDRLVLSHVSTPHDLTEYSVVSQIFAPVLALIAATASPLWSISVAARARGQAGPSLPRMVAVFTAAAAAICAGLVVISDAVGGVIGGEEVQLGVALPLAAALWVVVAAAAYPLAMTLNRPEDLRFLARLAVLSVPVHVGVSIVLADHIGAPGPLVASGMVAFGLQIVPAAIYAGRGSRPSPIAPTGPAPLEDLHARPDVIG